MLPILLLMLSTALADNCSYIYDGMQYTRTSILTIKGLPTNLVFNPNNKDLHFTLIDLESLQNDDVQTKMDQYILRNGEPIKIDDVNGQAAAVDVKNDRVYIGTDDGLTLLNKTDKANFVSLKDEDIVQVFKPNHGDDLYVVVFPNNEVFKINLKKNEKRRVQYVPCAFIIAVDADDNIFYECDSKYVKVLLKGFHEPIEFVGIAKNAARAIAIEDNHRVVLAANDGLYHLKSDNLIPKKLMNLDFVPAGIAFDDDDFFVSTNGIVYKYSNDECEE
ncbi:uncharacterized protein LOC125237217 isoform X2 [Leguminivora glycinivorella]|nr:uncharacterized protein LOC125237217 isoform X2 [Leguminivora glycinivorella]XP_048000173.1 uncharacterized protein LOC125237217 isoform X2 [Leguminivora glycinivorella]XP_048000174.1 uncharacterized protein LOC125237217 isoform X2 [Leguminivora glycinivorella]